jgi:hypothetical protein
MAGGGDHNSAQTNGGGHDQRAMEEGRKEAEYADHQGCAAMVVSVPFIQKVHNRHCEIDKTIYSVFFGSSPVPAAANYSLRGPISTFIMPPSNYLPFSTLIDLEFSSLCCTTAFHFVSSFFFFIIIAVF